MKKSVIIGASGGIGHEIASALLKKDVKVVNLSRTPSKLNIQNVKIDLTKNNDISKAIRTITKEHDDLDLLVLCAGVMHWHNIGENTASEIDNDFAVNLTGQIKLADGLMALIKKNKGDVVVIGSTGSFVTSTGGAIYAATKHGILGYIKSLQAELKKEDVRIIGLHPGGFQSQLHIKAGSDLKQEDLMDPKYLAKILISALELPRDMEVSEIIINRKKKG